MGGGWGAEKAEESEEFFLNKTNLVKNHAKKQLGTLPRDEIRGSEGSSRSSLQPFKASGIDPSILKLPLGVAKSFTLFEEQRFFLGNDDLFSFAEDSFWVLKAHLQTTRPCDPRPLRH